MTKAKIELHDKKLATLGFNAIIEFYRTIAIDELSFKEVFAFATGVDSPFLNVVIDRRQIKNNTAAFLADITEFFENHQVPWTWLVIPADEDNDLNTYGFSLLEEAPSLYFDLANPLPTIQNNAITVIEVSEKDDLRDWIKPLEEGFPPIEICEKYRQLNADLLHKGEKRLRHYIAHYENEIAGAATLFLGDDSVMLHNLATKVNFRKRGVGNALSLYRMRQAQELGYKHCFLDASEDGFHLHHNRGAFKIYSTILFYQKL